MRTATVSPTLSFRSNPVQVVAGLHVGIEPREVKSTVTPLLAVTGPCDCLMTERRVPESRPLLTCFPFNENSKHIIFSEVRAISSPTMASVLFERKEIAVTA